MIRVFLINKKELENIHYSEDLFSSSRKSKMEKMKREDARVMASCAELLLIYALKQMDPALSLPLDIMTDEHNKPYLKESPWHFNLSHAGDFAACAVSDEPVGVDIESVRVKELMSPNRILHPEEAQVLAYISNPAEKKKYFYECWVAKESYLKNLGIGLIVRPRDFAVRDDRLKIRDQDFSDLKGHHTAQISLSAEETPEGKDNTLNENLSYLQKRYVHVFEPGEVRGTDWKFDSGYRIAVCSMDKDPDMIARQIGAEQVNEALC